MYCLIDMNKTQNQNVFSDLLPDRIDSWVVKGTHRYSTRFARFCCAFCMQLHEEKVEALEHCVNSFFNLSGDN